ncbi:MAG: acetoin utilization protein AcuC [Gammaproteobacteria bacterium]|jgi:acetoin utilization protein AcuC|nr:acetoin utilization protein AcuC [Gammaproteobacteria bacterium]MDH3751547.1 acetoin utilization protein AcuC [Gammaproteobacteria bacterium]MDH3804993.1 acetoin utilization protein AcuC [Gammaproteobacteria bacterium]
MSEPVLVYRGDEIASYGFGDPHPFGLDRHGVFHDELARAGFGDAIEYAAPGAASIDDLLLFHTADYIDKVSRMSAEGEGYLDDGDTPAMAGIFDAASSVVGATLAAVDAIMDGKARRAFVPIAGLHHAGRNHAAGFCVFNDCGVAAEYLRKQHGLQRIAYVDIDAHHGDGMFYGFEDDQDLIIADIHEDGRYLYPGTGAASETGTGPAHGTKLNIPMPPGAGDSDFQRAWARVEAYIDDAKPEFILFQCGADSLEGDPITHLCYSEQAHADAATALCRLADKHCGGKVVGTGGGGYNRHNLARAWTRVVQSFVAAA